MIIKWGMKRTRTVLACVRFTLSRDKQLEDEDRLELESIEKELSTKWLEARTKRCEYAKKRYYANKNGVGKAEGNANQPI